MNAQSLSEHRLQTRKLAQELLDKRAQLWALREQLAKLQPYRLEQPLESLLRQFCQELIDYISLEHFGILHHILNDHEQNQHITALVSEIYTRMTETTDVALRFNDQCETWSATDVRLELPAALDALADALALRVELEDRLVHAMIA